jgi:parallel beta-helix repeat protein
VANLTLRQAGSKDLCYGVDISQGRLDLEGCDISSQSSACVAIRGGADPRLRRNKIHDGKQNGVFIQDGGLGTLEDNDITGNENAGVAIKTGNPTLRGNRINRNTYYAVRIGYGGRALVEDNDLTDNDQGAWRIEEDCQANVTQARNKE